jgi:DnaJ-domain-containing protein 1
MPRWADFTDPLDAIGARAAELRRRAAGRSAENGWAQGGARFTTEEREALGVMGLDPQADTKELRARYSLLVRKYHPDRNGGDRRHEAKLQQVVEAYQLLRKVVG